MNSSFRFGAASSKLRSFRKTAVVAFAFEPSWGQAKVSVIRFLYCEFVHRGHEGVHTGGVYSLAAKDKCTFFLAN